MKREIKWRMIDGLDKEEFVLLKFTKKETQTKLRWEHSREFEYNGQMYDIVDTEIKGDSIFYRCWWDHKETQLNKKLDKLVVQAFGKDPQKRNKQEQLFSFFKSFFSPEPVEWQQTAIHYERVVRHFPLYNAFFDPLIFPPPAPPPWQC